MINLYQFAPVWNIPNLSHFCVKVEIYLRMLDLPYKVVSTLPLKAPLGKLPYIEDGGVKIADSRFIIQYLQTHYGSHLSLHLSDYERATAKAWQRLVEEHLYWLSMYTRWHYSDTNWKQNKKAVFNTLPMFIRDFVALIYRYSIKKQIYNQGTGRLSEKEIFSLATEDVTALAIFLGDKDYFMGDKPTTIDATIYGFLINIIACPIESPLKEVTLEQPQLVDYCKRMQMRYFPECKTFEQ